MTAHGERGMRMTYGDKGNKLYIYKYQEGAFYNEC